MGGRAFHNRHLVLYSMSLEQDSLFCFVCTSQIVPSFYSQRHHNIGTKIDQKYYGCFEF